MSFVRSHMLVSFLVLVIFESRVVAQNNYDFNQFGHETIDCIKQPGKWDGRDWLRLGLMSGGALLTMQVDQPIRETAMSDRRYYYSVPIEAGRIYGELYSPVVFFTGFAAHSLVTNSMSSRKIAYEIGQASLYTGAITIILKTAFGRARPYMNEGNSSFHPFSLLFDRFHSFPGGHTATAFVLSTVLSRNAGPGWLKVLVYLPALLTPISRVYQDQHWMSDNVFGGALGYFVAAWVVDLHEKKDKEFQRTSGIPLISITVPLN